MDSKRRAMNVRITRGTLEKAEQFADREGANLAALTEAVFEGLPDEMPTITQAAIRAKEIAAARRSRRAK